jgi:hypothetical protein
MPPDVVCRITQSQPPPENTSVAPLLPQSEPIAPENITAWVRGLPARMPGGAGFQLACRGRGLPARMPGARASRPHTAMRSLTPAPPGGAGFQPAYGDTPHHPCTVWVRERRARMPEGAGVAPASSPLAARASRPHAGSAGVSPASSPLGARVSRPHAGYASVSLACRVRGRFARMQRCAPSEGGTPSSRGACVPPGVNSYTTLYCCFTAGIVLYCDPILG